MAFTNVFRPAAIALAIVVVLAGAYVLFVQIADVEGPPRIVTDSRSCVTDTATQSASAARVESRVPVAAWILGSREGALASWTKQVNDGEGMKTASGMEQWLAVARQQASAADASADRMAVVLKVTRPPAFTPPRGSAAFDALYQFVEDDEQATSRALALTYAPWVCELYKLGAYWGYSLPYRAGVRDMPNVLAQEINYYATRVGLPDSLTQRMTRGVASNSSDTQVFAEGEEISRAVAEYWAKR